jgi:hypothetical protein
LVTSEELRNARFGGEEYSTETEIDSTPDLAQSLALTSQSAAPADPQQQEPQVALNQKTVELTPTDLATIITVNEKRAEFGLPPWPEGNVSISEYQARNAAVIGKAQEAKDPSATTPTPTP